MAGRDKRKRPRGKPGKHRDQPLSDQPREEGTGEAARPQGATEPERPPEQIPGEREVIELVGPADESAVDEDQAPAEEGEDWGLRLRRGMSRSRRAITRPFTRAAAKKAITPEFWTDTEDALIAADAGVECSARIVENARKRIRAEGIRDIEGLKDAFRREVAAMLESFGEPPEPSPERPRVIFIAGVNGVGKTTTAAKIGFLLKEQGNRIVFAAADTFRAAGIEQMEMWAQRVGAPVVSHQAGGDPAAVVYDAIESAKAKAIDIVLVDTAGRLHTKKNLMEELGKMWRVAERQMSGRPEAILVIDATTGQNGVSQARIFGEALDVSSIALTKMDGSARGGVVMAIGMELGIPVAYIGVGEGLSDLKPFDPEQYAMALF